MDKDSARIVTEVIDSIAILRFNRPAQRNPLSLATLQDLKITLSALMSGGNIKAIIFTGADDVFLSGADIRELAQLGPKAALDFAKFGQSLFTKIADAKQVTIAAINGYCMGGGLDFALACDTRIASRTAVFAHPGATLGIITGWGGTQRLPRLIGRSRSLEFFVTARRYSSAAALEIGLITSVADPVLDSAVAKAGAAIAVASLS
jgi:enoyl-CoA hydratase